MNTTRIWTVRGAIVMAAVLGSGAGAVDIPVASPSDVTNAMQTAQPGDVLVLADGTYTDDLFRFQGDGAPGNPITLRAETPGQVVLNGTSRLEIGGTHLVVEGFFFDGGALTDGHVVRFRTSSRISSDCVLRDTAIVDYNPPSISTRYFWVSLYGDDNTVENCRFENQNHSGVTVVVWGNWPNNHIVRNNHFVDRPEGPENGWETIRIGTSDFIDQSSATTVESNLFERTDGEIEVISNKTGDNVYRYNTFREVAATLTLRHGFGALVHGNFFLGENVSGSGGIRVIGPGHRIWNNHFQDLAGRTQGIIALEAGELNGPNSGYEPVTDVIIAHNTVVDCGDPAFVLDRGLGGSRTVLPANVTLVGNLVSTPGENAATGTNPNLTWDDNLAFASGLGTASGAGVSLLGADPLSAGADGLERVMAGSAAIDAVGVQTVFVADDMDGQTRSGTYDAGSDEFSASAVTRAPLMPDDVGPSWWGGGVNPGGPDPSLGAFVEAENADTILDPDNDGDVFSVVADGSASEGFVLKAPPGSRTDLGSGPHDTIATYQVTFPASGTYTAYYRARASSGSTDSFFTPTAFGVDPDVNETTSNNGVFRWETGDVFAVGSGGVPLEFRIGKREQNCEIDVIVFYPDGALTEQELDDVLAASKLGPCELDLDGDGVLSFRDTIEYLKLHDANDPVADRNGNGTIDEFDKVRWLQDVAAGCP